MPKSSTRKRDSVASSQRVAIEELDARCAALEREFRAFKDAMLGQVVELGGVVGELREGAADAGSIDHRLKLILKRLNALERDFSTHLFLEHGQSASALSGVSSQREVCHESA